MKFVIDRHIPFIKGVLEPYGQTVYLDNSEITPSAVKDADALLIRTRTRIDADLLQGSRCRFVATATIGMDQFDLDFCRRAGITAYNAPGCNAPAVAQYVFANIGNFYPHAPEDAVIGIVGVGNIGRIVREWALGLGMKVMCVDPFRQMAEPSLTWHTLDDVARNADIITFHTPLTRTGEHPTFHLADKDFFSKLTRKPLLINASRGPVVDNAAWLEAIGADLVSGSIIDVWEGEPSVDTRLMNAATVSTPHIAGYSIDGKIRATQMVLDAVSRHFNLPALCADAPRPAVVPKQISLADAVDSYNPSSDTVYMRTALDGIDDPDRAKAVFERLRDSYPLRPEIKSTQES